MKWTVIVFALALSACVSPTPEANARKVADALVFPEEFSSTPAPDSEVVCGLLDLFDDETLARLVREALAHNLDLRLAARKMEEAGYAARAQRGARRPQLSAGFSANRSRDADGREVSEYRPELIVNWELDLWGKLRDQTLAADATALAEVEHAQALRDSIAAQVMQTWFEVVTTRRLMELEESRLRNLEKSAGNHRAAYRAGLGTLDDLFAVERDMAQTRATLSQTKDRHHGVIRTLRILLGRYPTVASDGGNELPKLLNPPRAGLPAELLTRRPDLRAAWQQVVSADHSVRVAQKELFPSISLTGSMGSQRDRFSDLVHGGTIWSLAGNLTQPLFNGGELRNKHRVERSRAEQAWVNYLRTVLQAFREVEEALDREHLLAEQETELEQAVRHARQTARVFTERYKNGLVSVLDYLAAENAVYALAAELVRTRGERLGNRVTLALALGKGV